MGSSETDREAVIRDVKRRVRCRTSLHSFAANIDVPTAPDSALELDEDLFGPAAAYMPRHHAAILATCERTITRPFGRALIMAPPGSAKSSYVSVVAPPWAMGRQRNQRIILTSYASTLAYRQSRRARQIAASQKYRDLWANKIEVVKDADPEWTLTNGSEFLAAGITAGITGNRANGAIIDDPVAGREEADSPAVRKKILDAYQDDLLTRLLPGAWIILIMCMTGDTPVLAADGKEWPLRDLMPGDVIATYDAGRLSTAVVLKHKSQGIDDVFEIELRSGTKLRANARHPFLTRDGSWKKLKHLKPGDNLVRLAAIRPTTQHPGASGELNTAMASRSLSTWLWSRLRAAAAQLAASLRARTSALTGAASSALTTTIQPEKCAGCCATTATLWSATAKHQKPSKPGPCTCDFVADEITAIRAAGREEVFDIQVEGTENFLAAGVVSHNTRWNEQDLAGEILPSDYKGASGMIRCRDGLDWEVLNMPAKCEHLDDPLGREIGEYIWPEYYPRKHWRMFEDGEGPTRQRTWSSLYQQRPTPQGSGRFTREMFNFYEKGELPQKLVKVIFSDFAVSEGKNDFTEHGVFGLDSDDNLWAVDWWFEQCNTGKGVGQMLEMASRHSCHLGFNEGGVIDKAIRPLVNAAIRDWNKDPKKTRIYLDLRSLPSMADKIAKLSSFQGRAAIGKVWFPRHAPWTEHVLQQLLALPAGRFDDAADVCGLAGRGLDQYHPPRNEPALRKEGIKPYSVAWLEYQENPTPAVRYR